MGVNFDDLAIRLANFSNKPTVDLSGKTDVKVQKALNIIYETVATSTSKNLIDKQRLLNKAESIVKQVDSSDASCHLEANQKQALHTKIAVPGIITLERQQANGALLLPAGL